MSQSFARLVSATMERIAPLRLAESWDNVGLLLESVPKPKTTSARKILLTIDLTPPVAQEALTKDIDLIISYHPPIFKPLSSLTFADPIQSSLLHLAHAGTSIYTPHTSLDSVTGGINDWLCSAFMKEEWKMSGGGGDGGPKTTTTTKYIEDKGDEKGGAGRMVSLPDPGLTIQEVVPMIKTLLGHSTLVQVAQPYDREDQDPIKSIAVCAGSGGSMFKDVDADLYFTGEMSHHEILAAIGRKKYVVLCGHTNTERGYLKVLREKLLAEKDLQFASVEISEKDAHPLRTWS